MNGSNYSYKNMLIVFDVQSKLDIFAAAVVFYFDVANDFSAIDLKDVEIDALYNDSREQIKFREFRQDDFEAVADFMSGLKRYFDIYKLQWLEEMKEDCLGELKVC